MSTRKQQQGGTTALIKRDKWNTMTHVSWLTTLSQMTMFRLPQ
jgi:hypothetical protein